MTGLTGPALRTIAVHLPAPAVAERLLDVALPLAEKHRALVVGVHVLPAVVVYADATVSMSTEFIVAQQEAFQEDAKAVERAFRSRLAPTGLAFEWRNGDTADEPTMRASSSCCNTADLVVASQYDETIPAAAGYAPDELVMGTGRPVLIVPRGGSAGPVGRRVLVGWNGSRESARATFDCLSLLDAGAEVQLAAVDSSRGAASIAAAAAALGRHNVQVKHVSFSRSEGRSVADELLRLAAEWDADLLVAGCYGHSRLRETVFGGATTRLLRTMTLPVLMAH
jgi:nucleotide-binding universal stress UspA family protein